MRIVGFVAGLSAVTPVALGPVTVRADAARLTDIPALACDMKAAMSSRLKADPAEAIDWDEVKELYEMPGENIDISPEQFARGQIFTSAFWTGLLDNDIPEVWSTYQEYFNCSTWLDKRVSATRTCPHYGASRPDIHVEPPRRQYVWLHSVEQCGSEVGILGRPGGRDGAPCCSIQVCAV